MVNSVLRFKHILAVFTTAASFFITGLSPAIAQSEGSSTLTVQVTGARNTKGRIGVLLFESAQGFPNDNSKAVRQQTVDIEPSTLSGQAVFKNLPHGTFAVAVLHDENGNGKMDKNLMGIPKEGYGASNNPPKKCVRLRSTKRGSRWTVRRRPSKSS